jgi:SAM-dependent methyltransferase
MPIVIKLNVDKYDKLYTKGHDHQYPNIDLVRLEKKYLTSKNNNILDYGFGSGESLIHLIKLGYDAYGIETSQKAIELVSKKMKERNIPKEKIKLFKLNESDKKIPFKDSFFDNIICMSVLSLLQTKANAALLINEFYRILKPEGKLIIDINGPEAAFKTKGKFISDDEFQSKVREGIYVNTYCPKSIDIFSRLLNKFQIDELGEVKFKYFDIIEHEFIACVRKKIR